MDISGKEMLKLFLNAGWEKKRQTGSHVIVCKGNRTIPVPVHNNALPEGLCKHLLKILRGLNDEISLQGSPGKAGFYCLV
ncbi:MAG TPA: type II toxin-antitoxin system HicA family toxin [Spirochaetota bacterium]|nr:type II toxin-antitoxin system HicA family toxin [Spirochaetota bacterium]